MRTITIWHVVTLPDTSCHTGPWLPLTCDTFSHTSPCWQYLMILPDTYYHSVCDTLDHTITCDVSGSKFKIQYIYSICNLFILILNISALNNHITVCDYVHVRDCWMVRVSECVCSWTTESRWYDLQFNKNYLFFPVS